jgi:hypothetical protein
MTKLHSFLQEPSSISNLHQLIVSRPLIAEYLVSGFSKLQAYNFTGKPKVNAHFRLNSNGMFVLEDAEAEITITIYPTEGFVDVLQN